MKIPIQVDLGFVEIGLDTETGILHSVWSDGVEVQNVSVKEFIRQSIPEAKWNEMIYKGIQEAKEIDKDDDSIFGVPV